MGMDMEMDITQAPLLRAAEKLCTQMYDVAIVFEYEICLCLDIIDDCNAL